MKAKVDELIKGADGREARLRAIFRFVSQEVRYMGITVEKDSPGYEPHDVALTFENRHGVCRDKAALLVAMLRLAGFKAFPVLIHTGPKKDPEVPQPFFNHAISAVENADGSYTLMDSTDENTKDLFPAYLCNKSYLVARPEGDTLRTSPIIPASKNMMRIQTRGSIDGEGNLRGTSTMLFEGINDNVYRGFLSRLKPEQRRRFFEGAVKAMSAGARLTAFDIQPKNLLDTESPLQITIAFEAENILVTNGVTSMLSLPRLGNRVGMVNFILRSAGLKKRKYPFVNEFACGVQEHLRYELDPAIGTVKALPTFPPIDTKTLGWSLNMNVKDGVLTADGIFTIRTVEFSPKQYLELKKTLKTLEVYGRKKAILVRGESADAQADSILLDSVREYDLHDPNNWTLVHRVKRKILTYNGKKSFAELKWDFNPVWENVELIHAAVTTAGTTKKISKEEINLMDAGWVASAPRYPGAKTLVASLPGVEVGSVIEYEVKHTIRNRPFFAMRQFFRGYDPVKRKVVRLRVPKGIQLKMRIYQGGVLHPDAETVIRQTETTDEQGRTTYTWSAADQPAVRREDALPPWEAFMPVVFISTGDWDDYSRQVLRALKTATKKSPAIEKLAGELRRTANNRVDLVRRIRDRVAKRIRYAGPPLYALPLDAVSPAEATLADGYGNQTDVAVLLAALLKAAGFRPAFVLGSSLPMVDELEKPFTDFPTRGAFGDVLVQVHVRGLGSILLNDTNQYAALGTTAHDGRLGLDLRHAKPMRLRAIPGKSDRREIDYALTIDEAGNATLTRTILTFGQAYAAFHRKFSEMPPEERRRYHQEVLSGLSQGAEADGDLKTEFDVYPGVETVSATIPNFAVKDGDYLYFNLPSSLHNLLGLRSDTRKGPLYWGGVRRLRLRTRIELPPSYRTAVLLPESFFWNAPQDAGTVWIDVDMGKNGVLTLVHDVDLQPAIFPPDSYQELLEVNRRLSHPNARTVLLLKEKKAKQGTSNNP